jgi:DNA-binding transcriptional LysR family regulator
VNDRIRELDTFLRVAEEGSFSAAARSLDCDPSTVSKIIQRLEDRLRARLFHRTSRAFNLTQEGERFLVGALRVIGALEDAEQSLKHSTAEATGVLRINSTLAFARHYLVPFIPEFLGGHPGLKLDFLLTGTALNIYEQQIDISFQVGAIPDSSLVAKRIATARWIMCASPSYLEKAGAPRTPMDLQHHNCLNFMPGSYRSHWPVRNGSKAEMLEPKGNAATNSGDMLSALTCTGLGIARLADYHIAAELASGRLVPLLEEFQLDEAEPVFAVYASKRNVSVRIKAFLEFLEKQLSGAQRGASGAVLPRTGPSRSPRRDGKATPLPAPSR